MEIKFKKILELVKNMQKNDKRNLKNIIANSSIKNLENTKYKYYLETLINYPNKVNFIDKIIKTYKIKKDYFIDYENNCIKDYKIIKNIKGGFFGTIYIVEKKIKNM